MNTCIFILAGARIETYSFDLVTVLQLNNEASFELLRKGIVSCTNETHRDGASTLTSS